VNVSEKRDLEILEQRPEALDYFNLNSKTL
jgi:hypothetical protein